MRQNRSKILHPYHKGFAKQHLCCSGTGLFSGGELSQEDMDIMMKAIQDAYWIAKEKNQRFVPKKHRLNEQ